MPYKPLNQGGDAWDFKEISELEGEYIGSRSNIGPNNSMMHDIKEQTSGEIVSCWGCASLDNQLSRVEKGSKVLIAYKGLTKNPKTGRTYKDFEISVWESE